MATLLGIGNAFVDRTIYVAPGFAEKHKLNKNDGIIASFEDLNKAWGDAKANVPTNVPKIDSEEESLGGSTLNTIKATARMGLFTTAIAGRVGFDHRGFEVRGKLRRLEIEDLLVESKNSNGIANCFCTPDGERTMQTYLGSAEDSKESDVKEAYFKNPKLRHVRLEGYTAFFGRVMDTSVEYAERYKVPVGLDLSSSFLVKSFRSKYDHAVPRVKYVFGNMQEMRAYTGRDDVRDMVGHFDRKQYVFITDGANGCWVKAEGCTSLVHYEALNVSKKVVTTIGAGDYFGAGATIGILQGKTPFEIVSLANLMASYVVQQPGAELPEDKWKELREKVNPTPPKFV